MINTNLKLKNMSKEIKKADLQAEKIIELTRQRDELLDLLYDIDSNIKNSGIILPSNIEKVEELLTKYKK